MAVLSFKLNAHLYLRDPQHTELGQSIIQKSIELIDQLGFEQFTFKKLAEAIHTTEASVYRYFENKHRLLHYLTAWYWSWIEYRIEMAVGNLTQPEEKLFGCLRVLTEEKKYDPSFDFIDEVALNRIVIAELDKTYLTKWVDEDNKEGLFLGFKSLCNRIASIVLEINPQYPYPHSLISTLMLAVKQQLYFADHLPSLTDLRNSNNRHEELYRMLTSFAKAAVQPNNRN